MEWFDAKKYLPRNNDKVFVRCFLEENGCSREYFDMAYYDHELEVWSNSYVTHWCKCQFKEDDVVEEGFYRDRQWLELALAIRDNDIRTYRDILEYLEENQILNVDKIIETINGNDRLDSLGYVKVKKFIDEKQKLNLNYEINGVKYIAQVDSFDLYGGRQVTDGEDSYHGHWLFPTWKEDEYFCLYYEC